MITIMPCLEVLRSFSDKNIISPASKIRVQSFDIANELIAESNANILIPSQLYDMIAPRLNADQKAAFETLYRIDNSTKTATPSYGVEQAIKLLSDAESKARAVIILTENVSTYPSLNNGRIRVIKPNDFIQIINLLRAWKKRGRISTIDEALLIYLFKD